VKHVRVHYEVQTASGRHMFDKLHRATAFAKERGATIIIKVTVEDVPLRRKKTGAPPPCPYHKTSEGSAQFWGCKRCEAVERYALKAEVERLKDVLADYQGRAAYVKKLGEWKRMVAQRDALATENARLRAALERVAADGPPPPKGQWSEDIAREALEKP
jgi:hypothetical protein